MTFQPPLGLASSCAVASFGRGEMGQKPMLSVVIATENAEQRLVPTLAALVPGAMAGVVREVIVADAGSSDATMYLVMTYASDLA